MGFSAVAQKTLKGTASFYNNKFNGRKTASGAIFSNKGMTCACNRLPLGTKIKVTNTKNGKSVVVVVNDRLAANNHRLVDLTERAAKELGFFSSGLTQVEVEVLQKKRPVEKESEIKEEDSIDVDPIIVEPAVVDSVKKVL